MVWRRTSRCSRRGRLKVFATPFYNVKLTIKSPDGAQTQDLVVYRQGDKLLTVSSGHTDGDLPELVKMFNGTFKLKTDEDGKTLQKALDVVYGDEDKKIAAVSHSGNQ